MLNQFCAKCGGLADYDPYYERYYCTKCTSSWARPRTRYEVILAPTIEEVAMRNIIEVSYFAEGEDINRTYRFNFPSEYQSSDYQRFHDYQDAVNHEIAWLNEPS